VTDLRENGEIDEGLVITKRARVGWEREGASGPHLLVPRKSRFP
jgi:hypothetical protein